MQRRMFVKRCAGLWSAALVSITGCRSTQHARVLNSHDRGMVGSHQAGGETYPVLIDEAVAKLLGRACRPSDIQPAGLNVGERKKICFIGVENCTAEEIGDFKEQIYELIDSKLNESEMYEQLSRRYVDAGLQQLRLRPDELFIKENQRNFQAVMEEMGQSFDYLLYAKLTSGTTRRNSDTQRDYLMTLEIVNIHTGKYEKESATLRKGYYRSWFGKVFG